MKTRICLGALAFPLLTLVPAFAFENEFSYDEFEINDLPEVQEESEWEFSVGIEGVFGKAKMSGYGDAYIRDEYYWWRGEYVRKKTDFENFYGFNFRLNWLKNSSDEDSMFTPEVYLLLGFMTGSTQEDVDEQLTLLSCTAGGNMHMPLSDSVSVFGGVRLGGGILLSEHKASSTVTYGVGAGVLIHLGNRGDAIRFGADYLMCSSNHDDEGFSVSNPKWILFSVGYNVSF